jgi:hypothetical protein
MSKTHYTLGCLLIIFFALGGLFLAQPVIVLEAEGRLTRWISLGSPLGQVIKILYAGNTEVIIESEGDEFYRLDLFGHPSKEWVSTEWPVEVYEGSTEFCPEYQLLPPPVQYPGPVTQEAVYLNCQSHTFLETRYVLLSSGEIYFWRHASHNNMFNQLCFSLVGIFSWRFHGVGDRLNFHREKITIAEP